MTALPSAKLLAGSRPAFARALATGAVVAIGFTPIWSILLLVFLHVPLHISFRALVLPGAVLALALGGLMRPLGRAALTGLLCGIAATAVYDLARAGFLAAGIGHDFVPNIGRLALNRADAPWVCGYIWRWIGNGGGMGMAFATLGWWLGAQRWWRAPIGLAYGLWVCTNLFLTLWIAPQAESVLFRLTPGTAIMAVVGHVVYGLVLGALLAWRRETGVRGASEPRESALAAVLERVKLHSTIMPAP